jgi:hypothetical protein
LTSVARFGVIRINQGFQLGPRDDGLHGIEKMLSPTGPRKLLKAHLIRKGYLPHRHLHLHTI